MIIQILIQKKRGKKKVKAEILGREILAVTVNSPAVVPSSGHMLALFCGGSPKRICEHFWVPGRKEGRKKKGETLPSAKQQLKTPDGPNKQRRRQRENEQSR